MRGACLLLQSRFDAGAVLDAIEQYRTTMVKIVPTVLYRLLRAQQEQPRDLSSLRLLAYGAAPMPEPLLREAMEVFPCLFSQTYGQAEAPATIACLGPLEHAQERKEPGTLLRSVGRPYPTADVAVLGSNGSEAAQGEIGEVCVGGGFITAGYWERPDLNEKLLSNGRVRTGDMGYLSGGYLYLVGRKNDTIITGGFNVYPPEVENALLDIPGVSDAAVTSVPDQEWGEKVVAAVVLDPGSELTASELRARCRERIAGYKTPKEIRLVGALPLTANTKIDRPAIRELFTDDHSDERHSAAPA
jgi:fatty-acyl-CoA synthase